MLISEVDLGCPNFLPPPILTNFRAPFLKEIPFFFCGVTPSKTLAAPEPLNIAFPLGNGGVLRSEERGGIQEGGGRWGGGKKKRKKGRAKSAQNIGGRSLRRTGEIGKRKRHINRNVLLW